MAWGQTKNKPFEADYNRQYDTHTSGRTDASNFSNDPSYADTPTDSARLGEGLARSYRVTQLDEPVQIGPREIATGNAPSGGYQTDPGLGWAQDWQRSRAYRPYRVVEDYEAGQAIVNAQRDLDIRERRYNARVAEDLATPKGLAPSLPIRAVEHSPYEREWSEAHGPHGEPGPTVRSNPNPWSFFRDWDNPGDGYRGSGARYLNGERTSQAVHNTLNPYSEQEDGMAPRRQGRNTYRVDPAPWDGPQTDGPGNTPGYVSRLNRSADGDPSGGLSRTYRL